MLKVLIQPQARTGLGQDEASVALRTSSGSRRRSSPFNSIRSKACRKTLASCRRCGRRSACRHHRSRLTVDDARPGAQHIQVDRSRAFPAKDPNESSITQFFSS
jgi:hypothetical protein